MSFIETFSKSLSKQQFDKWTEKDEKLFFEGKSFNKESSTQLKSSKGFPYSVWSIFTCYKDRKLDYGKYISNCFENGIKRVDMVDRKKILRIIKNSNLTSKELEKKQTGGIVKKLKKSKILKIHDDEIFTYSINGYNQCPSLKPKECFELIAKFETVLKRERRGIDIKSKKVQNDPDSKNKVPIILVPSAVTALINIYNAQNFLENNQFVACGEDNLLIRQKNRKINVQLTKNSERKIFRLTDSIHNIEEWDNVVAVIVSGKNWQFKKYKYKPPMLFSKIKGFYFQWDGQSTERHIQNWNVEILKISRNNRNKDQKVVFDFWKILSAFLEKVKFSY